MPGYPFSKSQIGAIIIASFFLCLAGQENLEAWRIWLNMAIAAFAMILATVFPVFDETAATKGQENTETTKRSLKPTARMFINLILVNFVYAIIVSIITVYGAFSFAVFAGPVDGSALVLTLVLWKLVAIASSICAVPELLIHCVAADDGGRQNSHLTKWYIGLGSNLRLSMCMALGAGVVATAATVSQFI